MNDGGYMAVSPHSSNIVFCTGNLYPSSTWDIGVSHSSDGGTTWVHDTLTQGSNGLAIAYDPFDTNRVYVAGDSAYDYSDPAFLITTDLGATWTSSHTGMTGRVWTIAADPNQSGLLYCGTYQGVFKSTNGGATWSGTGFAHDTRALVIDAATGDVYAGTYGNGVYISTDAGATWNPLNTGLTNENVLSLDGRSGSELTLLAGTDGGGVFCTSLPTGIAGSHSGVRGSQLALSVSPNPCHATALIRFSTPRTTSTRLTLYDASGRFVRELVPQSSWITLRTAQLTPGAYFVRLSDGVEARTARLTVLE
jgi:photosystem II stability/assembly factor-like uncharacterized protein